MAVLWVCHPGASRGTAGQSPRGLSGPAPQHRLSQRAPGCPSGEIIPGILQIWNCSVLISLFQLACPTTLAPRAGSRLAVSLGRRAGCHCPARRPPSHGERHWGALLPAGEGAKAEDVAPPLLPQTSNSPPFLSPTPVCGPEPACAPVHTHPCPVRCTSPPLSPPLSPQNSG